MLKVGVVGSGKVSLKSMLVNLEKIGVVQPVEFNPEAIVFDEVSYSPAETRQPIMKSLEMLTKLRLEDFDAGLYIGEVPQDQCGTVLKAITYDFKGKAGNA